MAEPESTYVRLDNQKWKDKLESELIASGLPDAIKTLTREMVDRARRNALLSEADAIIRMLRKMGNEQEYVLFPYSPSLFHLISSCRRKLLEARRTKNDYDAAKRGYDQARKQFEFVLETWNREEHMQIRENRVLVERASVIISQKAYTSVGQAIERTLRDRRLRDVQLEDEKPGRGPRGASAGEKGVSVLGHPAWTRCTEQVPYRAPRF